MEIIPFFSIGVLSFGDERQVAREKLAAPFTTFRKGPFAQNETDSVDELGLHLYYSSDDRLEFVEAFSPADVRFRGVEFLEREIDSVVADMAAIGFGYAKSDVGVKFPDAGIALTAPDGLVEGVAAHRKGYYD